MRTVHVQSVTGTLAGLRHVSKHELEMTGQRKPMIIGKWNISWPVGLSSCPDLIIDRKLEGVFLCY